MSVRSRLLRSNPKIPPLPIYKAALQQMRAGVRNARVLCVGDSYTAGDFSDPAALDYYQNAWPRQLGLLMTANGTKASCNSVCGFQYAFYQGSPFQNNFDPRVVMTGAAKAGTTNASIGGAQCQFPSAASAIAFTPNDQVDTFRLYFWNTGIANTFNVNINGGSNTLVSAGGTVGFGSQVFTGTLGTNTLNAVWVSGYADIVGWEAWNSQVTQVNLINAGCSGSTSGNWNTNASLHAMYYSMAEIAADLVIIELGINDFNTSQSLSSYITNMQALITASKQAGSDVVLLTGGHWDATGSGIAYATQTTFWQAMKQLAVQNNVAMIDITYRWQSFAAATSQGLYATGSFANSSHPSILGQKDYAQAVFNAIGRM
jgi:lysophospholipase L1-like esterase